MGNYLEYNLMHIKIDPKCKKHVLVNEIVLNGNNKIKFYMQVRMK